MSGDGGAAARLFFGDQAVHVPAWFYVQDQGPGVVGLVGSSKTAGDNPLRFGAPHYDDSRGYAGQGPGYWSHHLVVGELVVRPHLIIGTNAVQGQGISGLYTAGHDLDAMLADGELVYDTAGTLARLRGAR